MTTFRPDTTGGDSNLPRRAFIAGAAAAAAAAAFRPTAAAAATDTTGHVISVRYSTRSSNTNGEVSIEEEGADGIRSITSQTGWASAPPMRLRISRAAPDDNGAKHLLVMPYQYGMAVDYPGVVECWVTDWSIHGRGLGARLWVGNHDDTGGILLTASRQGGVRFGEITAQLFTGETGGSLRFTVRAPADSFEFRSGPNGQEKTSLRVTAGGDLVAREESDAQVRLGETGGSGTPGIAFGKQGAVRLYAEGDRALRTDSVLTAAGGLGFKTAKPATGVGKLSSTVEVFDETGASLGVLPIYEPAAAPTATG